MSGTSGDGIDCCVVDFSLKVPQIRATHFVKFNSEMKKKVFSITEVSEQSVNQLALIENEITKEFAQATNVLLEQASLDASSISAIGCHGQTVAHNPRGGYSLQLVNGALLAELTGITTVIDFRNTDIASGGEGAPLAPAFHDYVFRSEHIHRVIVNIGGMANLTNLAPNYPTTGFDTGPGNILLDQMAIKYLNKPFDQDGSWARSGRVDNEFLRNLEEHPFFNKTPPKSCGKQEFNLSWAEALASPGIKPNDIQATFLQLTVNSILKSIKMHCGSAEKIYMCGGGALNKHLMEKLADREPRGLIGKTDELGIEAEWVEAMAFAWLAQKAVDKKPIDFSRITGSRNSRILGAVYFR